jgi:hypothetical protein
MVKETSQTRTNARRRVEVLDIDACHAVADGINAIYDGRHDVIVVRGAFDATLMARAGERCDADEVDLGWTRPNRAMPVEDLQILGTDNPATPSYQSPRGASLEAYLASAAANDGKAGVVFPPGYDVVGAIRAVLGQFAGGLPVEVASSGDGRRFVPYTLRRMPDGKQIGIHHDNHYQLDLYRELAAELDTTTLVSYVATLREPVSGGELFVYGATSDASDLPRLANGFAFDLAAIESRYDCARIVTHPGDLFLLAAGRCLHRVGRVQGPRARVTMGGFLALDRPHQRVLFWS